MELTDLVSNLTTNIDSTKLIISAGFGLASGTICSYINGIYGKNEQPVSENSQYENSQNKKILDGTNFFFPIVWGIGFTGIFVQGISYSMEATSYALALRASFEAGYDLVYRTLFHNKG